MLFLLIAIVGCQAQHEQTILEQQAQSKLEADQHAAKVKQEIAEIIRDGDEDQRKFEITVAAIRTVRVGDTVQQFEAKILPARQLLLRFDGDSSTSTIETRRYHIRPEDRGATYTVFIHNNRVMDYVIVGFK